MKVSVIGLGLIGGSIAKGLRHSGYAVSGWDSDCQVRELAGDLIPITQPDQEVDVIIVAVPLQEREQVIEKILKSNPSALITDTGSFMLESNDPRFIPGHPMAGKAQGGWTQSEADLFSGATWALSHQSDQLAEIIKALGARVEIISSAEHNQAVARYSHLPQLLSSLLAGVNDQKDQEGARISGPAYRDMTRIAASPPDMWTEIIDANLLAIKPLLSELIDELIKLEEILSISDWEALTKFLEAGNQGRVELIKRRWSS